MPELSHKRLQDVFRRGLTSGQVVLQDFLDFVAEFHDNDLMRRAVPQ